MMEFGIMFALVAVGILILVHAWDMVDDLR